VANYVVTTNSNSGAGSLRAAITAANGDGVPSMITFDPGLAGQTITLSSGLPQLTDANTTIDGDISGNMAPDIRIALTTSAPGFDVAGDDIVLKHVSITGAGTGILLEAQADRATISENYIGVALDGVTAGSNTGPGVLVQGTGHSIDGNVISANGGDGILVLLGVANITIRSNVIGASADLTVPLGNAQAGIYSLATVTIGGTGAGEGNVIVANGSSGIFLQGVSGSVQGAVVQGNEVGIDGLTGNGNDGITIANALSVIVGGVATGAANTIHNNGQAGVRVSGADSTGARIRANSIANNTSKGILRDGGAQTLVLAPTLSVMGTTLNGAGVPNASVDVFRTDTPPDASGAGEGETYLGSVQADGAGQFSFPLTGLTPGTFTATQTDANNNTSEFAANVTVGP